MPFHGNLDLDGGQLFGNYGSTLTTANGKRTTRNRRSQQLWTCPRDFHPLQFTKDSTSIAGSQYPATVVFLCGDHDREPAGVVFDFENDIRHRAKLYESGNNSVRAACYFVFLSSVEIQSQEGSDISNSKPRRFPAEEQKKAKLWNVMLLMETHEGFFERVAVGRLNADLLSTRGLSFVEPHFIRLL